jgi:hypothetical protein
MQPWVIVYVPGSNIYQMLDECPLKKEPMRHRIIKGSVRTFLTCAQLWWWLKS